MSCSIGEFNKIKHKPILKKYAYYRMLSCLLCKNECKNMINKAFCHIGCSDEKRYYAETLKT